MMCVVYWFNPLVWFAVRRMQVEAEQACDDYVLNMGYKSTDYAQHLIEIVRTAKIAGSFSRAAVAIGRSSKIEERVRMILAENLNRRPLTKVSLVSGYCIVIFFAMQLGAMRLVEAGNQENGLYQEIQSVSNSHPEPLAKDVTEADKDAWRKESQRNMESVIALCDKFLSAFPESDRYDEIWYEKLIYLRLLRRDDEFDAGVAVFLSERPSSKYADKLRSLQAHRLESQFKFPEALAEWDKIDDPAMLYKVYDRKGQIYSRMNNWEKRAEYDLLRAELILGKPAPEFSHTSVYGDPVSLGTLRGKVVVLYHWSTSDGRTARDDETGGEITNLKHLYAKHRNNPEFVLICVCTDRSESRLKEFVNIHAMPGSHLLLKPDEVPHQFGVIGLPYYVVVDRAGILRESAHGFELSDLEIELLVVALLKEEMNAPGDLIIQRISQARAEVYSFQDQEEKTINEYEKVLTFMPNTPHIMSQIRYRKFNLLMEEIYRRREQTDAMTVLMNKAYNQIVGWSQSSIGADAHQALDLALLFSQQGDRDKTWTLFQIAVMHDDDNYSSAINYAKQKPERFAAIQDMPEFQKLLADSPQTEVDKRDAEEARKREMYVDELSAAYKSFTAVEADGEIYTGVILTRIGHILVPATATNAKVIRAKIVDYQPVKIVAVDAESDLAVIKADGQKNLRPVDLGSTSDLREYTLIPLPNPSEGYSYAEILVISTRGFPNVPNLSPEIHQQALGRPLARHAAVMRLDIDDNGKVAELKVAAPGHPSEFIRGDAMVYHDGRLLAISLENEVKYANWGPSTDPIPIDQIRAALERMNMTQLMDGTAGNQGRIE
jgi:peroxiredoxin